MLGDMELEREAVMVEDWDEQADTLEVKLPVLQLLGVRLTLTVPQLVWLSDFWAEVVGVKDGVRELVELTQVETVSEGDEEVVPETLIEN